MLPVAGPGRGGQTVHVADDQTTVVHGDEQLIARAGHLFNTVRDVCATRDVGLWSLSEARMAAARRVHTALPDGFALRKLLSEGLIEVEAENVIVGDQIIEREPHTPPATSDEDLKRYWFVLTRAGWTEYEAGADETRAYHAAHPIQENR